MPPESGILPSAVPDPEVSEAAPSAPALLLEDGTLVAGREADEIVTYALDPITAENTSGLKSVLLDILGPYENIVTEYRYMNNNQSYYSYMREITPDYPWFGSLAVFLILLFSVFRIGGNLLWKR